MTKTNNLAGALTIMMAANAIEDFEVTERDNGVHVRVWSSTDNSRIRAQLRGHVTALLSDHANGRALTVVDAEA
jgi:hypothetical protein